MGWPVGAERGMMGANGETRLSLALLRLRRNVIAEPRREHAAVTRAQRPRQPRHRRQIAHAVALQLVDVVVVVADAELVELLSEPADRVGHVGAAPGRDGRHILDLGELCF